MATSPTPNVDEVPFRISAGLKRLIGRDLITDPTVAILELVKNSYDAHATEAHLVFLDDQIVVLDDGKGMSRDGLLKRWLFVAYSAKRDGTEDADYKPAARGGYRDRLKLRRAYAGRKGVGRFSCDRLGASLLLQTKTSGKGGVQCLRVDWDQYEQDDKQEFMDIKTRLHAASTADLPSGSWPRRLKHGTALTITKLRDGQSWDRDQLQRLRRALAKLIDPLGGGEDSFTISVHAPSFLDEDRILADGEDPFAGPLAPRHYNEVVNGPIQNFIFDTLKQKTTYIEVRIPAGTKKIETSLTDRGELVYRIRERNEKFPLLSVEGVSAKLFYLNRAAKQTFALRMGIPSVNFGSVFLFKEGFRIYPIGERNDDTFGVARRKQQGYARQLGTREIIGRIDVSGSDEAFRESTSRDQGLIRTPAYEELESFFKVHVLRRLEKYVVDVTWVDSLDAERDDVSGLEVTEGVARVTELVGALAGNKRITILATSTRLVRLLDEKAANIDKHLASVRAIAEKTGNQTLLNDAELASARLRRALRAEGEAARAADREAAGRRKAQEQAEAEAEARRRTQEAYEEEKKRALFLASLTGADKSSLLDMLHHVGIKSDTLIRRHENQLKRLRRGKAVSNEDWREYLTTNAMILRQVQAVAHMATKANFRLQSDRMTDDLVTFIAQYVAQVSQVFAGEGLTMATEGTELGFVTPFRPIEIGTVLDNLSSNARKAGATRMAFRFSLQDERLTMEVADDGQGIPASIVEPERVFDLGVTTTDGSGIGLYHVRQALSRMDATIRMTEPQPSTGASFTLEFQRET